MLGRLKELSGLGRVPLGGLDRVAGPALSGILDIPALIHDAGYRERHDAGGIVRSLLARRLADGAPSGLSPSRCSC